MEQRSKEVKGRRKRRSSAELAALIAEFKQSGLSMRVFCERRGLNVNSFRNQRYRLEQQGNLQEFVTVGMLDTDLDSSRPLFAEYRGLMIYQQVDPAYLKALIN